MKAGPLSMIVFACVALSAHAQPYRWIDEKGRVHYTDTPPPASAKQAEKKKLRDNAVGEQPSYTLEQAAKTSPVTLYTHPDCKEPCQLARAALNQRGVPFKEVKAIDTATIDQLKQLSGEAIVPLLVVGGQVEKTMSADAYNRALDIAGYPKAGTFRPRREPASPAATPEPPAEAAPAAPGS